MMTTILSHLPELVAGTFRNALPSKATLQATVTSYLLDLNLDNLWQVLTVPLHHLAHVATVEDQEETVAVPAPGSCSPLTPFLQHLLPAPDPTPGTLAEVREHK